MSWMRIAGFVFVLGLVAACKIDAKTPNQCQTDDQCREGAYCDVGRALCVLACEKAGCLEGHFCDPDSHFCKDYCPHACPALPVNATLMCGEVCVYACNDGFRECAGREGVCLSNSSDDPTACGADCVVCPTENGVAVCKDGACGYAYCGDGITNGLEVCDDGNTVTETECPYGTRACMPCSNDCSRVLSLTGPYCGDAKITDNEKCDDDRSFTCGTCDRSTCEIVPMKSATGTITVTSMVADGDSFTISDGINGPVTFELDTNGLCASGSDRKCVVVGTANTTAKIATAIQSAIAQEQTAGALVIVATVESNVVVLSNNTPGISGNHDIVVSTTRGALVSGGMEGGVGCPNGAMCEMNEDCVSIRCSLSTGRCIP